jgi:hypothetical protein
VNTPMEPEKKGGRKRRISETQEVLLNQIRYVVC